VAVAYDTTTESSTGTTGQSGAASFTWNHTGGASARGALVFVFGVVTNALPPVTSVTYGGATMTAIPYTAIDTDTEPGSVRAYYLDNCGTGTKAVVVNRSDTTPWAHVLYAVCHTVTAAGPTEVYLPGVKTQAGSSAAVTAGNSSGTGTATNAGLLSIDDGSPGTNSLRFMGRYQGTSNVTAAGTGSTAPASAVGSIDFGLYVIETFYETTAGQGARNVGGANISDDLAVIALAVREIPPVLVQPAAAAVTIGTATATIVAQNWPKAEPAAAAVTIGTATPAVVLSVGVQPAAAAVTIGTATPAVATPIGVAPGAAAVSVAGATPAVLLPIAAAPAAAAVGIATATPAVVTVTVIQPAAASVSITSATPAVVAQNYQLVQPAAAAITIGTATPALVAQDWPKAAPAAAAVSIAGATPDVVAQNYILVQPAAAAITIAGATGAIAATQTYAPDAADVTVTTGTPAISATQTYLPAAASLALVGAVPAVGVGASVTVVPDPAALTATGASPAVRIATVVLPAAASLVLATATPAIAATQTYVPSPATIVMAGRVPRVTTGAPQPEPQGYVVRRMRPALDVVGAQDDDEVIELLFAP
jgi:hypothetical protein